MLASCSATPFPLSSDLPLTSLDGETELPVEALVDAARPPSKGMVVRTVGRLTSARTAAGHVALTLESIEQPGAVVTLVVRPGPDAETLASYRGRVVTLAAAVDGTVPLPGGGTALEISPLQYAARFDPTRAPDPEVADLQETVDEVASEFTQDAARHRARFAGEPSAAATVDELDYELHYLDSHLDRPRWSLAGSRSIERTRAGGVSEYRYTIVTPATRGDETQTVVCEFRVEGGDLRAKSMHETVRDASERITQERRIDFSGTYRDKARATDVPWPENIYPAPCLELVLMGLPFESKRLLNLAVWTDLEPNAPMNAIIDGIETISVPAGTFRAYRVRMRFDEEAYLARLGLPMQIGYEIARSMMEQLRQAHSIFWVSVERPRHVLRVQGPLGPPGITRGVIELVDRRKSAPPTDR